MTYTLNHSGILSIFNPYNYSKGVNSVFISLTNIIMPGRHLCTTNAECSGGKRCSPKSRTCVSAATARKHELERTRLHELNAAGDPAIKEALWLREPGGTRYSRELRDILVADDIEDYRRSNTAFGFTKTYTKLAAPAQRFVDKIEHGPWARHMILEAWNWRDSLSSLFGAPRDDNRKTPFLFVAQDASGDITGIAYGHHRPARKTVYVDALATLPRRGWGRRLMKQVELYARKKKAKHVELVTVSDAYTFYQDLGYSRGPPGATPKNAAAIQAYKNSKNELTRAHPDAWQGRYYPDNSNEAHEQLPKYHFTLNRRR